MTGHGDGEDHGPAVAQETAHFQPQDRGTEAAHRGRGALQSVGQAGLGGHCAAFRSLVGWSGVVTGQGDECILEPT